MALYDQVDVRNLHVRSLIERADASIVNILKCESCNSQTLRPADATRFKSYVSELRRWRAFVISEPFLDLPKSHPNVLVLDYVGQDESRHVQNRSCRDLAALFEAVIVELAESESAMLASGLQKFDDDRIVALMDQMDHLIEFMENDEPYDKPESSPHAPEVESGSLNSAPQH